MDRPAGTLHPHRPPTRRLAGLAYGAAQAMRVSWFWGNYALARRLAPPRRAERKRAPTADPSPGPQARMPSWPTVRADMATLFRRDWDNIKRGLYPPPAMLPHPVATARLARRFLADLARVDAHRREEPADEALRARHGGRLPRYYLQKFHDQTDGYLSAESAALYDYQVEVLFAGAADAMRRQALVPLARHFAAHRTRGSNLIDIGCGTGRFLTFVKAAHPRLSVLGVDLSAAYVAHARRALAPWSRARMAVANAEALPVATASQDVATCVYLFHELPHAVRHTVATEIARVLRPGGLFVFVDSIQTGDHPPYDDLLNRFPEAVHEPFFADYLAHDLEGLFADAGLQPVSCERALFSRVMTCRRREGHPA